MKHDMFSLCSILAVCAFVLYLIIRCITLQQRVVEGMATGPKSGTAAAKPGTASSNLATAITQLQDELLVSKYQGDYENAILSMEEYVTLLMLKELNTIDLQGGSSNSLNGVQNLGILQSSLGALNTMMAYVEKQSG